LGSIGITPGTATEVYFGVIIIIVPYLLLSCVPYLLNHSCTNSLAFVGVRFRQC
jgi:hypothetical protein